jgi:antitoxin component of MazEF toxin-antitoxin module
MVKKLTRHGNSLAFVIEKPILDPLGLDADTPIEVTMDGEALVVTPVHDAKRRKAFEDALGNANRKYGRALKRLAT